MIDETRLRRLKVRESILLELFRPIGQCVAIRLKHPKLPDDAKILSVHHDYCSRAFSVLVSSSTFDPVDPGREVPLLDDNAADFICKHVDGDRLVDSMPVSKWGASPLTPVLDILAAHDRMLNNQGFWGSKPIDDKGIATRDIAAGELVECSAEAMRAIECRPVPAAMVADESQGTGRQVVETELDFFKRSILAE